ncbi:uncharacterized protein LOC116945813 isoform X9 [Petromyzon marinus]|uniref:Uncharacterized protein LOC116945813 isoform X10 n=1 Tax=Petromyzon marinus TaxID=7757 RepID=A0AAJ7TEB1_PETMA|nr:uncharacterized protein LOC116945813 isoform X10 [Petromyzon marinus]XP_032816260.1 uncharacterized protein LOC116945813 isoform X10 [Petromyzon marinus]XP_032816261.1 uncharacterized protein LOC116945813 isoform X10 [Petromyzon marinus]XP_032816262.1 uncharacterized protein LOC116945813 isoform X10 [Petromyzon marinus]XP_032816264.1 uncharacterized protein LOC116945813 isoform X10 [Petromyzon marinus]XP_032816265.1 uncharacterized protein LOC116945813 isoform X10 [Petromyzon marinus]
MMKNIAERVNSVRAVRAGSAADTARSSGAGRTLCTARTSPLQEELGRPLEAAGHGGPSLPRDLAPKSDSQGKTAPEPGGTLPLSTTCGGGGGGRGGRAGGKALGSRGPVWRPGTSLQSACRASSEMCIASSHVEVESRDEKARSLEDTIMELCTARWRPSRPTVRPTPGSSLAGARTPALAAQLQSL